MQSSLINEISDMLMECNLFNDFSGGSLKSVARYFTTNKIDQGEIIFKEGDIGNFMCIINTGKVSVSKSNHEYKEVRIATLPSGRAFGEMAVLDSERRSATCRAGDDCTVLILSKDSLDKMFIETPRTAAMVFRTIAISLSRRLRVADGELVEHHI